MDCGCGGVRCLHHLFFRLQDLKAQIKECDDSTAVYRERLRLLESDHETLERIVREEYLMKRENEDLYIVNE